jgi:hypothetical protein
MKSHAKKNTITAFEKIDKNVNVAKGAPPYTVGAQK